MGLNLESRGTAEAEQGSSVRAERANLVTVG